MNCYPCCETQREPIYGVSPVGSFSAFVLDCGKADTEPWPCRVRGGKRWPSRRALLAVGRLARLLVDGIFSLGAHFMTPSKAQGLPWD